MTDHGELGASLFQEYFPQFGSFLTLCTYKQASDSTYTVASGDATDTKSNEKTLNILFTGFAMTQGTSPTRIVDDVPVLSVDRIAIFPALDLPYTPEVDDIITDDKSVDWIVKGIGDDPKPMHYQLHVRPVKDNTP